MVHLTHAARCGNPRWTTSLVSGQCLLARGLIVCRSSTRFRSTLFSSTRSQGSERRLPIFVAFCSKRPTVNCIRCQAKRGLPLARHLQLNTSHGVVPVPSVIFLHRVVGWYRIHIEDCHRRPCRIALCGFYTGNRFTVASALVWKIYTESIQNPYGLYRNVFSDVAVKLETNCGS